MEGFIKLHRQIIKWEWYDDANTFRLFIHLLIKANHADGNWRGYEIKRGQTFTSIGNLAHELSLSEKAIRIAIDKLVRTKEIISKGASNGTMITICNYDIYQINDKHEGRTKGQSKGELRANEGRQTINDNNDINENKLSVQLILEKTSQYFDKKYITEETKNVLSKLLKTYTKEQIINCIVWAKTDSFWCNNFLSISKLDKFNKDKVKYIDVFLAKSKMYVIPQQEKKQPLDYR